MLYNCTFCEYLIVTVALTLGLMDQILLKQRETVGAVVGTYLNMFGPLNVLCLLKLNS